MKIENRRKDHSEKITKSKTIKKNQKNQKRKVSHV